MDTKDSTLGAIGRTALIRLREASRATGCEILGKAEFLNPGGSVKDRAALGMIRDAERNGLIRPGATIVEGTAGNTGIGLALVGNALGYRTIIVMPKTQSQEKVDTLRAYGAEVRLIPAVPFKNPDHFVHTSRRLAEEMNENDPGSAFWANQFDNTANYLFHKETTGAEIWSQTDGRVDGFVCAVGTGGTLAGVGQALKAHNPVIRIALADPGGSGLFAYYDSGEITMEGSSI
ncbi:MAG: pyridoxal-phosphate dependent enzyme, partial [Gammaproteobacteria bacterium]